MAQAATTAQCFLLTGRLYLAVGWRWWFKVCFALPILQHQEERIPDKSIQEGAYYEAVFEEVIGYYNFTPETSSKRFRDKADCYHNDAGRQSEDEAGKARPVGTDEFEFKNKNQ